MKFILLALTASLLVIGCTASKSPAKSKKGLPFKGVEFALLEGNLRDSNIIFSTHPEQCFTIKFNGKSGYDGSFEIKGSSDDTNSVYHTSAAYVGFYKLYDGNRISMYWLKPISRHEMGKSIAGLFHFKGTYQYNGSTLAFYSEETGNSQPQISMQACDLKSLQMEYPLEYYH